MVSISQSCRGAEKLSHCQRESPVGADRALRTSSLLKKPADKDDCADMVVAMCRTETMTGQTVVIDSGRIFH